MDPDFKVHKPQIDPIPPSSESDQPSQPKKSRKSNWLSSYKGFISIFQLIAGALLLAFIINQFIFQSYEVFGQSMTPTLSQGDRLIISKVSKSWNSLWNNDYQPGRGEIVVFRNPRNNTTQLVKRVIGLPGDRVVVDGGQITVFNDENPDGFNPDEDQQLDLASTDGRVDLTVPDGQIFVVGDNRIPNGSYDSRSPDLGTVPIDVVVGELVLRIFPLTEAKFF
ncbi:MAG: signal peptidase I [Candidatus Saccharimonadales bacterium]|nr:signal peptidase I [Candidatus Saccharimonadales bacterium]